MLESRAGFEAEYRRLIEALRQTGLPIVACAIYNPCSDEEGFQRTAIAALCLYNDAIIATARSFGLPVIDLRAVCSEVSDYANEIEPSAHGGAKIADAILHVVTSHDFASARCFLSPPG